MNISIKGSKGDKTFAEILDWLELPENHDKIRYLQNFEHMKNLEELKDMKGLGGLISRIVLFFTDRHIGAMLELAKVRTADDIAAFRQTAHYQKIKNFSIDDWDDLELLEELEELKQLDEFKNL